MARNHIIVWVGRDLKGISFQPPAMGWETFHQTRLLKRGLGHFRGGASTDSLGSRDLMSSTPREALWDHGHGCRKCGMGCEGLRGSRR